MSINMDKVTKLTEQLSQGTKHLIKGNEEARLHLMQVTQKLAQALQTPRETFLKLWLLDVSVSKGSDRSTGLWEVGWIIIILTLISLGYYEGRTASCLRFEATRPYP